MAVQQATAEKWLKVTGCPIVEGYGLSETSPVATANRLDNRNFTGTIGCCRCHRPKSPSWTTTATTSTSAVGEIAIRGPSGDGWLLEPCR